MKKNNSKKNGQKEIKLKSARPPRPLSAKDANVFLTKGALRDFKTTKEIQPLDEIVGQKRAMEALEVGLGIAQEGYNIFVSGLTGTGKMETIRQSLEQRLKNSAVPDDWVYVHNFDKADEPWAIRLKPGEGRKLKRDMKRLVERLQEELPKAFRQEDFSKEKEQLAEKYQGQLEQQMKDLEQKATEKGFAIRRSPDGNLFFLPLIEGKPLESEEQLHKLSEEERKRMEEGQKELAKETSRIFRNQRDLFSELTEEVRAAERDFGSAYVRPMIDKLKQSHKDNERLLKYFDRVEKHILENLADFRQAGQQQPIQGPIPGLLMMNQQPPQFTEYNVNVVVDHSESKGAPVIVEEYPTFKNLFGNIDRTPEPGGRWSTDFTQIKAGSMLRANGGYLVFNLDDAVTEPLVYKNLKRVLKSGHHRFDTYDPFSFFGAVGLRPEPIPISTKVVVVGNPWLYLLLRFYDDEFGSIFKIKAEFGTEMDRGKTEQWHYARFVAMLAQQEKLRPFNRDAVIEIIRFGARRASQQNKLFTRFSEVANVLREANFFAGNDKADVVDEKHVRKSIQSHTFRSDRIAEKIRELIADGTLLIDIKGRRVGQINGLAVADLGDYAFGRPTRLTATVGLGTHGLINIEREAKLSGSTHDKGVLILGGYLRQQYGQDKPLALSASICFEQSYTGIDGDSASSTELYALLSSIAGVSIRQDIAVTGSINQWGQIQAIGGVNEKVEGFYDVCRVVGLTGKQGVCIPKSNVRNLVLRDDVLQAIDDKKFHLYAIETVDEGIELLTGIKAGSPKQEATFHWLVDQRLRKMAEDLRNFGAPQVPPSLLVARQEIPPHVPPKLPDENP